MKFVGPIKFILCNAFLIGAVTFSFQGLAQDRTIEELTRQGEIQESYPRNHRRRRVNLRSRLRRDCLKENPRLKAQALESCIATKRRAFIDSAPQPERLKK